MLSIGEFCEAEVKGVFNMKTKFDCQRFEIVS